MKNLKNPFLIGYVVIYMISLAILNSSENFSIGNSVTILVIVGFGFSGLAFILTRFSKPMKITVSGSSKEMFFLVFSVIVIVVFLTWGSRALSNLFLSSFDKTSFVTHFGHLIQKLFFFVAIPLFVMLKYFGYSLKDFGIQFKNTGSNWKSHLPVMVGLVLFFILFNYFVGRGAEPIREGHFSAMQLIIGMPLSFIWLLLEVGLVEEFFFRAYLQTRLAVFFKSKLSGIITACLIFGLAHAPGLYLRGAGSITALGDSPTFIFAVAYSIVTLSVAGFFLGIIWIRTRNLPLLMVIHAAGDLMPGYPELMQVFNI
ncbi:MAG: CPBP family intramembrane metalloprotease [Candidatus Marinimicrobia bacterium]|nr:CPBP family intramembrane metalloprotease [Candidatus Neomarinimicrobiota bacterium]MBT3633070.1 CPBP family intramembrane metalloprotease [Candidatus Neomarinimicrobiota bacterium]MBT3682329.1 CPBP family intramembrane metalloprotease [Candidatus Neomarinimicrobiota bacterium]MBT3758670.1 CPBP family intramembrane metalloprotease [Candidatus Neomarinimicrobiota bacterium]MBT4172094.1 CPBP family intramembrane metalloprotease [Candidatus Neomarinimicrobiota bacterium]